MSEPGDTHYLPCPECDGPGIPSSGWDRMTHAPTWTEDDEAECPECCVRLGARITGDGEAEWMEAFLIEGGGM